MESCWNRHSVSYPHQWLSVNSETLSLLHLGNALVDAGEAFKQMADVKYGLEDVVKQNFLDPLTHLQANDLKEVSVRVGNLWMQNVYYFKLCFDFSITEKSCKVAVSITIANVANKSKVSCVILFLPHRILS